MANYRKSPELKLFEGTTRPDREEKVSVSFVKSESDTPAPSGLDSFGKKKWKELVKHLTDAGVLDKVDQLGLENICYSYQRSRSYRKEELGCEKRLKGLEEELGLTADAKEKKELLKQISGMYDRIDRARLNQRKEAELQKGYLGEYGATPAAKRRLPAKKNDKSNPLEELLKGLKVVKKA